MAHELNRSATDCPAWQRCHGSQTKCPLCGDVSAVCTLEKCYHHTCLGCERWPVACYGGSCMACLVDNTVQFAEAAMVDAAERGDAKTEKLSRELFELFKDFELRR